MNSVAINNDIGIEKISDHHSYIRYRWKFVMSSVVLTLVVIARKWHHNLFYLPPYFSARGGFFFPESFTWAYFSNGCKSVKELSRYFEMKFFLFSNTVKSGQSLMFNYYLCKTKDFWNVISPDGTRCFIFFKNMLAKRSWG